MKLHGKLVPRAQITPPERAAMFELMQQYYAAVNPDTFNVDLQEKDWVIMLFEPQTGKLCGFSTQMLISLPMEEQIVTVLFSGDTIIAREYWGDVALSHVWGNLVWSLIDRYPPNTLYWFLISKGYKTYRFLPVFFKEFYPRYDCPTPAWARHLIDRLGQHKFPHAYDAAAGLIRAYPGKDYLLHGIADITPERLQDPHIRFFLTQNPQHDLGEELCCIAPLTQENFTPAGIRVIKARSIDRTDYQSSASGNQP